MLETKNRLIRCSDIKITKLTETAKLPTRGSEYAAGWDLYADNYEGCKGQKDWTLIIPPNTTVKIGTGIAIALPSYTFGGIYPRSGLATKCGLAPANKVGVIDADYRGELIVALHNHSTFPQSINQGDRIAQLIVQSYFNFDWEIVDTLDETERGSSGFGSTGEN